MCLYVLYLFDDCALPNGFKYVSLGSASYWPVQRLSHDQLFEIIKVCSKLIMCTAITLLDVSEIELRNDKMTRINSNVNLNKWSDRALIVADRKLKADQMLN
jgi:hypothetical protein